jgi:hypothetical protein
VGDKSSITKLIVTRKEAVIYVLLHVTIQTSWTKRQSSEVTCRFQAPTTCPKERVILRQLHSGLQANIHKRNTTRMMFTAVSYEDATGGKFGNHDKVSVTVTSAF